MPVFDAGLAVLAAVQVPDLTVVLGAFAPWDMPGGTLAFVIGQVVAGGPAQDEPQLMSAQFPEPGSAGESPVEDVDHPPLPPLGALREQGCGLLPAVAGQLAPAGPPAHGGQGGRPLHTGHHQEVHGCRRPSRASVPAGYLLVKL